MDQKAYLKVGTLCSDYTEGLSNDHDNVLWASFFVGNEVV